MMSFILALIVYMKLLLNVQHFDNCKNNPNCPNEPYFSCDSQSLKSYCNEVLVELIDETIAYQYVLHLHNDYRNAIANGSISELPPAGQMAKMTWNKELAKAALENVRLCKNEKVECVNTVDFKNVGQNKAKIKIPEELGTIFSINEYIQKCISNWFDEWKLNVFTNHFANMIQANGTSVGCAGLLELAEDLSLNIHFVCHYARGFVPDMAVYHSGEPASECKTGTDDKYSALCSENEIFDPNYEIVVMKNDSEHETTQDESENY